MCWSFQNRGLRGVRDPDLIHAGGEPGKKGIDMRGVGSQVRSRAVLIDCSYIPLFRVAPTRYGSSTVPGFVCLGGRCHCGPAMLTLPEGVIGAAGKAVDAADLEAPGRGAGRLWRAGTPW